MRIFPVLWALTSGGVRMLGSKDMALIYKIVSKDEWKKAEETGVFPGAAVDIADGFIHFSTGEQVAETANKHFKEQKNLLLVAVDEDELDEEALRYEVSRGDAFFPHLYGDLSLEAVVGVSPFEADGKGIFHFSEVLP